MSDAATRFFESLSTRGPTVLSEPMAGTLRIDLTEDGAGEHWLVTFEGFQVTVQRAMREADAVWTLSRRLFDDLLMGKSQEIAVLLRNEATFSGDVLLLLAFRRFLPDRGDSRDPRVGRRAAQVARR
jgi:SCP-2 sterol transfer family